MRKSFNACLAASVVIIAPTLTVSAPAAPSGAADFASRCADCHSTEPGKNGIGPPLAGVCGRTGGTAPGYAYSPAICRSIRSC